MHRYEPAIGTIQIHALGCFAVVLDVVVWNLLAFADRRGFSVEPWTAAHHESMMLQSVSQVRERWLLLAPVVLPTWITRSIGREYTDTSKAEQSAHAQLLRFR
jgi:hypothetical protein